MVKAWAEHLNEILRKTHKNQTQKKKIAKTNRVDLKCLKRFKQLICSKLKQSDQQQLMKEIFCRNKSQTQSQKVSFCLRLWLFYWQIVHMVVSKVRVKLQTTLIFMGLYRLLLLDKRSVRLMCVPVPQRALTQLKSPRIKTFLKPV